MQVSQSVPQVTQDSQVGAILNTLFDTLQARLSAGSPFSDCRSAYMAFEKLVQLGPWAVSIAYNGETKILSLRANTPYEQIEALALAVRKGRGAYDVTFDRPAFDQWAVQLLPAPAVEPDRFVADFGLTDAELASPPTAEYRRIVEQAQAAASPAEIPTITNISPAPQAQPEPALTVWDLTRRAIEAPGFSLQVGKRHPLWHSGGRRVDLYRRPTDNLICLTAANGAPGCITSRPIAICRDGRWRLMSGAESNYRAWQKAVSANLRPNVEQSQNGGTSQQAVTR